MLHVGLRVLYAPRRHQTQHGLRGKDCATKQKAEVGGVEVSPQNHCEFGDWGEHLLPQNRS